MAISEGQRRRRGSRLRVIALAIVVLAALAAAAIVATASNHSGAVGAATKRTGSLEIGGRRAGESRAAARRRLQKENAAINAVLRYTPFLANGVPRRRMIALTFDDGPSPYTPQIIRILLRMHVPATFFIVGQQLPVFPNALLDAVRHGFTIGDHTQNHASLPRLGAGGQFGQINAAALGAQRLGAPYPRLFRPPYGTYNQQTVATLRRLKMLMVLWSIDPGDWRRPGVGPIVKNVLANARAGAVVIMHDGGGDRSQTVTALPQIINGLRKRHFQLVSLPLLLIW